MHITFIFDCPLIGRSIQSILVFGYLCSLYYFESRLRLQGLLYLTSNLRILFLYFRIFTGRKRNLLNKRFIFFIILFLVILIILLVVLLIFLILNVIVYGYSFGLLLEIIHISQKSHILITDYRLFVLLKIISQLIHYFALN